MILETIDELRAQGAQSLDASRFNAIRWCYCHFEQHGAGIVFCDGNHERSEPCTWQPLTVEHVKAMAQVAIAAYVLPGTVPHIARPAAAQPRTDEHIANAVATVGQLSPDDLATFAKQLVAADAVQCDWLIDALLYALELEPDNGRHGRIAAKVATVQRGAAFVEAERRKLAVRTFANALRDRIDADIEALLRVAQ